MEKQELIKFIEWLPLNVEEFKESSPEDIINTLNNLSQTEEGNSTIEKWINQFKQSTRALKWGGKLNILINKFQKGGKSKQRYSDIGRKQFHGIDLFEYSPNKYQSWGGYSVRRDLKPGTNKTTFKNGVQLRQITRNNITTSEFVSPDKRDTLYIHNGVAGRVDSNIDDSGILGLLGLRKSEPVSERFRELQRKFNAQKFLEGGEIDKEEGKTTDESQLKTRRSNITGKEYILFPVDTTNNIVTRKIARVIPNGYDIVIQKQVVGHPDSTSYTQFRNVDINAKTGYPVTAEIPMPSKDTWLFNYKKDRIKYNKILEDLFNSDK